jgi:hypothetical protein
MKPVFKCDYCSKMGTEEEIREHEPVCIDNYDRKSCCTCAHKKFKPKNNSMWNYECEVGREIPEGKMFEFCESYERKEKNPLLNNLFGNMFGGY